MKTATIRELRNHCVSVMKWVESGEEVKISRRGKVIARLVPEKPKRPKKVDWSTSAALNQDKTGWKVISDEEKASLFD